MALYVAIRLLAAFTAVQPDLYRRDCRQYEDIVTRLKDKIALITGVSVGAGREIAILFARRRQARHQFAERPRQRPRGRDQQKACADRGGLSSGKVEPTTAESTKLNQHHGSEPRAPRLAA